jgi:asparagine synthase (glutamine-hydrolysing)
VCGIGGIVGGAPAAAATLERMAAEMAHRGPDGQGTWSEEAAGLAFRRLAIIDLDERSNQPMHLGSLHLVFNGEIYNYIELRAELRDLGHAFRTEGDAEVLLHAWAQWGEGALDRFNGMFAFAIWDDAGATLTLATDPFAEKPLFYHQRGARLTFASDVRALRAADPTIGIPDERALRDYLALAAMPALPATFFADVRRLPGAHLARFRAGSLELRRYWSPRQIDVPATPADAAEQLGELLSDSVRLRLRSDVPVGTSLSGGVDSSAIVSRCARIAGDHRRHAFTAAFDGFARDEWRYASEVAAAAGVQCHHAVRPTIDELLRDLERLVYDQEEPFGSTSIYAQWRVMAAARDAGVTVMLDGQGADELFGGYAGSDGWALASMGWRAALSGVRHDWRLAAPLAVALGAQRAPRSLAARYRLRGASPYVSAAAAQAAAGEPDADPTWEPGGSPLRRALLAQSFRLSLPVLLRYADRNSMAHSIELRLPFLDRRVAEFALSLPAAILYRDGFRKQVLRDAVRADVPAGVLARRDKVGYETPEEHWFGSVKGRERVGEILLDRESRAGESYERAAIEQDLAAGSWRDVHAVWRAVNAELWLRAFATAPVSVGA